MKYLAFTVSVMITMIPGASSAFTLDCFGTRADALHLGSHEFTIRFNDKNRTAKISISNETMGVFIGDRWIVLRHEHLSKITPGEISDNWYINRKTGEYQQTSFQNFCRFSDSSKCGTSLGRHETDFKYGRGNCNANF